MKSIQNHGQEILNGAKWVEPNCRGVRNKQRAPYCLKWEQEGACTQSMQLEKLRVQKFSR